MIREFADSKTLQAETVTMAATAISRPPDRSDRAIGDGFMNIPDGVEDEGLPFN